MAEETAHLIVKADTTQVENASRKLGDFASQGKKAEESVSGFSSATNVMANSVKVLAAAFASLKILEYAKEAAMLSARYESLGTVMATVGKNSGYTAQQMEATAQALQKTGISMIGSREQVLKLVQSHIDLAHATKLARIAQDAAVIANINSTESFNRLTHGIRTGQTEVLRSLGLNISIEESYKKYAQTLGITSNALTQSQKNQAVLNAVMKEGETIAGTYEAAMQTAGKMINSTERYVENLKVKLGGLFDGATLTSVTAYTDLLKELDKQTDSMAASGELKDWAHRIAIEFAFLADITRVFAGQAKILFNMLATGFGQIKSGNFAGLTATFMNADEALKALYADGTKYQDQVNKRIISEGLLSKQITGTNNNSKELKDTTNELSNATGGITSRTKAYNVEVYKLKEAEKELAGARDIEYQKLKRHESLLNEAKQLTEQNRTAQEKYNDTINRYNTLRPQLTAETYSRAVANATNELERSRSEVNKFDQASKQSSENWRHAWSNMEQTGRMAFTQFAAHGVSAMESIGNALKLAVFDLLYHLTVRKWIINIGTSIEGSLFGAAGGAGGGGTNIFAGGFGKGVTGLIGRGGSSLPGSLGTFFSGMAGSAGTGAFSAAGGAGTAFIGGPGTAIGGSGMGGIASMGARMGAGLSAAAGPMMAAYAATQLFKGLAGDKQIGGGFGKFVDKISNIPILGDMLPIAPLLKALFGRGPLKQKETELTGDIGLGGFESGMLQTTFKAKGGLFRSNKTDFARVDAITGEIWTDNQKQLGQFAKDLSKAAKDIFSAFNETAKQSSKLLNDTAKDLGLSNDALKDFNYQIKLVSEKGKGLTEEQIADEIENMSTAMAEKLIPNIQDFTKAGEVAIDAVSRLHSEFLAIDNAARILGLSLSDAHSYAQNMGIELRTAFTDAAGGADAFSSKMAYVSENFLTEERRFEMGTESLNKSLSDLAIPLDITKDGFYKLLQSVGAAGDAVKFSKLLDIAPLFNDISKASELLADKAKEAAEATRKQAEAIAAAERQAFVGNRRAGELSKSSQIEELKSQFADVAKEIFSIDKNYLYREFIASRMAFDPPEAYGFDPRTGFAEESKRLEYNNVFSTTARYFTEDFGNVLASISGNGMFSSVEGASAAVQHLQKALADLKPVAEQNAKIEESRLELEKKIADERLRLEDQLFSMTASLAEKRAKELSLLDPSNKALQERIFALQDEQEAAQRLAKIAEESMQKTAQIAQERYGLEGQLLQLQGNIVELRKRELDTIDPSNKALQERIFALQDEQSAAQATAQAAQELMQKTAQISQEKIGLETQLLQAQGNTAELRRRELEVLDPSNQFLQRRIWQIEDERIAIEQANLALESIKANVGTAFGALQKSVEKERGLITDKYNKDLEESAKRIDTVSESIGKLKSLSDALRNATEQINPLGLEGARGQIRAAISTGNLESPALINAISILANGGGVFASKIDAQRNQARNFELLAQLNVVTDNQLTLEQRTLSALESVRDRLAVAYEDEMLRLDSIIENAQLQIDALNNINNSVLSIPAAINSLAAAMQSQAAAQVATAQPYSRHVDNDGPGGGAGFTYMSASLASFDSGGRVPKTGIAMIHKDEQILTKSESKSLEQNLEEMKTAIEILTITQNKINRRFDKWDNEGLPDTRVA